MAAFLDTIFSRLSANPVNLICDMEWRNTCLDMSGLAIGAPPANLGVRPALQPGLLHVAGGNLGGHAAGVKGRRGRTQLLAMLVVFQEETEGP